MMCPLTRTTSEAMGPSIAPTARWSRPVRWGSIYRKPVLPMMDATRVEARTQALSRELLKRARRHHAHLTTLNHWTAQVVAWCLSDPRLKTQVLRLIDCLPSLQSPRAVVQHLRDYFASDGLRLPAALRLGVAWSRAGLFTAPMAAFTIHRMVEQVARQFIAATKPEDAVEVIQRFAARGVLVSFDVLGEQVVSESEADAYAARYAQLITVLSAGCDRAPARHESGGAGGGSIRPHLSIKPSSLSSRADPLRFEESVESILGRLVPLARLADARGVAITLDMESYELRDLTLEVAKRLLRDPEAGARMRLGIVIQAYLRDAEPVLEELLAWLAAHRRQVDVRLVKGAYWDYEVARAQQQGWPEPVYRDKRQTDDAFERLTLRLLESHPAVRTQIGSHSVRSVAHAMASAQARGLAAGDLEFQVLYGMGEAIQEGVREMGYPVRVYAPLGELVPGMAYLVRRLLENTANESLLRQDAFRDG